MDMGANFRVLILQLSFLILSGYSMGISSDSCYRNPLYGAKSASLNFDLNATYHYHTFILDAGFPFVIFATLVRNILTLPQFAMNWGFSFRWDS